MTEPLRNNKFYYYQLYGREISMKSSNFWVKVFWKFRPVQAHNLNPKH